MSTVSTSIDNLQVAHFRNKFGEPHYQLACLAAVPWLLSPDLLYKLWRNFRTSAPIAADMPTAVAAKQLTIPYESVSDLLLSSLCRPVGYQLYQMDDKVRTLLLKQLPEAQKKQIATFLQQYAEGSRSITGELVQKIHLKTAQSILEPFKFAKDIEKTLKNNENNESEKIHSLRLYYGLQNTDSANNPNMGLCLLEANDDDDDYDTEIQLPNDLRGRIKAKAAAATAKRETYTETAFGLNLQMVLIGGGTFMMGSPASEAGLSDDEQQHQVTLSDYYIGAYEVTQAQWRAVMGSNPSNFKGDDLPVERVTWDEVQEFLDKLNAQTGKKYRLPTEAQWEYAARGGTTTPFYTGNCLSTDQANYNGNYPCQNCEKGEYREKTTPVGSFAANPYGLYDMHGNIWEWCHDWYGADYYQNSPTNNPTGPSTGTYRVLRGGSWFSFAQSCRVAYRNSYVPSDRCDDSGFRLAVGP